MGNVLNGPICLFKGRSYGEGLQVSSQSVIGFLLFTVILAKANYIVHRESAAEAGVPVVHTAANCSQW